MTGSLLLVYFFAVIAAVLAIQTLAAANEHLRERHPDLYDEYDRNKDKHSWPDRLWELILGIMVHESHPGFGTLRERIAQDLKRAGKPTQLTPEIFIAQSLLQGLGVFLGLSFCSLVIFRQPLILLSVGAGALHAFGIRPNSLHADAEARVRTIHRRLPYAIDLLVLMLNAGITLDEGLEMIADQDHEDPLAEEFAIALQEIQAGAPHSKALEGIAKRLAIEEVTTLILAINQGAEKGTPMAEVLTVQAELFRTRRIQRAEKMASEAPIKMMFPNMLIMIAVLLIILGPLLISLSRSGIFS